MKKLLFFLAIIGLISSSPAFCKKSGDWGNKPKIERKLAGDQG